MSGWSLALMLMLVSPEACAQSVSEDALVAGRALRWSMRGLVPFKQEAARLRAARRFRNGIIASGPDESRSQCALLAGELLRAGGLRAAASRDLMLGVSLDAGEWSARCALSAGELCLDDGRPAEALLVLSSVANSTAPSRLAEQAVVLVGVALAAIGEAVAAVELWRSVAEGGVTPRHRFDAFERWGQHLLTLGDLEGAAGVLSQCRFTLEASAFEMTSTGRALRKLLNESSLARSIHRETRSRYRKRWRKMSG